MSEGPKCERCREYNAAAVDYRNEAANLRADLAALLARHNALREEFEDVKDHNQYLEACLEDRNAEMMRHVRMYEDLCEAVAWERECEEIRTWLIMTRRYPNKTSARWELYDEFYCARAEVDRLIAEREG